MFIFKTVLGFKKWNNERQKDKYTLKRNAETFRVQIWIIQCILRILDMLIDLLCSLVLSQMVSKGSTRFSVREDNWPSCSRPWLLRVVHEALIWFIYLASKEFAVREFMISWWWVVESCQKIQKIVRYFFHLVFSLECAFFILLCITS